MPQKLGVAVHGAGWVAGEHIKSFARNPHCEVRVVSSRREASARAKIYETGVGAEPETDYGRVLQRADIDIVAICTPSDRHAEHTIAAAQAGKHVLIEKPVALNLPDLHRMQDAVRQAGVKSVVSFVLRWNPMIQTVKALIDDGALGDIIIAETGYFHDIGTWYSGWEWARTKAIGGSNMLFAGCHAMDALRYLAGDIVEISAHATDLHNKGYEYPSTVTASMQLASGALGLIASSFEIPVPYTFPIQLYGSKGAIRDGQLFSRAKFPGQTGRITIPASSPDSGDVATMAFQGEIDELVDCILNDRGSHCNLDDAVKTHEACFALDLSAAERRPVKLPLR